MSKHRTPSADRDPKAGITLRELEVLQQLIRCGTTMNVARELGISQSAVSRRLAQLEDRLGIRLFERAGGRLVATVEALSISEQLRPVFETLERIVRQAETDRRPFAGRMIVVAPPTIAHRFLPPLVAAFARRNPDLQIVFEVMPSDALVTGIAEGRFDLGLTDTQSAHEGIRAERLISTQAVCLLPDRHHLASRNTIRPEDLDGVTFISLSRRHSSRTAIDRLFEREGVSRKLTFEASTNVSVGEFVRAGLGVALVNPFPIVHQLGPGIVVRPFVPKVPYTTNFLMSSNRPPSAAALAFIAAVESSLDRAQFPGA